MSLALCFSLVLTDTAPANPRPDAKPLQIAVQPLGQVKAENISAVALCLRVEYGATVTVLAPVPLPPEVFYPLRQRDRADKILAFLERTVPAAFPMVIAITEKDISVTKGDIPDWGVFGYAILAGRVSVVSTFRLSRKPSPLVSPRQRLQRVAIHEVGHLFGLEHCSSPVCVMRDCQGSIDRVDIDGKDFCPSCRVSILKFGRTDPN